LAQTLNVMAAGRVPLRPQPEPLDTSQLLTQRRGAGRSVEAVSRRPRGQIGRRRAVRPAHLPERGSLSSSPSTNCRSQTNGEFRLGGRPHANTEHLTPNAEHRLANSQPRFIMALRLLHGRKDDHRLVTHNPLRNSSRYGQSLWLLRPIIVSIILSLTGVTAGSWYSTNLNPIGLSAVRAASNPTMVVKRTAGGPYPLTITAGSPTIYYGDGWPTITPTYTGLMNGDKGPSTPPTCYIQGQNGPAPVAGRYTTFCSGASDPNYSPISYVNGTLTVQKSRLTITAPTFTTGYGPIPALVPTFAGFENGHNPGNLTSLPTCTTAAGSTGAVAQLGTYAVTCSGASDPNYDIRYAQGTMTVIPASLTVTASSASIGHGAQVPPITPIYSGFVNGDTASTALTGSPVCSTDATSSSPVGTYPTTCAQGTLAANHGNYAFTFVPGAITIGTAPLTVTAGSASIYYGDGWPAITPTYTGLLNGDKAPNTPATCTIQGEFGPAPVVGSYVTVCSSASDPNYGPITYINGKLTVVKSRLTITAPTLSAPYGPIPNLDPTYAGFVNGDTASSLASPPTCTTASGGTGTVVPLGVYTITCSGAADPNYDIRYAQGQLSVVPASLTVSAASPSSVYGSKVPAITPVYTGFVNGDTAATALTGAPVCSTIANSATPVGTYASTCKQGTLAANDGNYTFTFAPGVVTIEKASLIITASSPSIYYGDGWPLIAAKYSGLVNGDTEPEFTPTCDIPQRTNKPPLVGSYATTCSGASDPNYTITYMSGSLTVQKHRLTVTAPTVTFHYGPIPVLSPSYAGFQNGDTRASLNPRPFCTTSAGSVGALAQIGPYTDNCTGAGDPNYDFKYIQGSVTVTPAPLRVKAIGATIVHGDRLPAVTAHYSGFVKGESAATALTGAPVCSTGATSSSPAGRYATTCTQGTLAAKGSHYSFRFVRGTLIVLPALLTISASSASITYGDRIPAITAAYAGWKNLDGLAQLTSKPACGVPASQHGKALSAGTYKTECSGAASPDYRFSYVTGSLTVRRSGVKVAYAGPQAITRGGRARLTALLRSAAGRPIQGRTMTIQVGTGKHPQKSLTGKTNARGQAICRITRVTVSRGRQTVIIRFSGDSPGNQYDYAAGTARATVNVRRATG
jgi:MBG domain (YGX type)